MDALPLVDQLMGFLQAQPQEKAALKRLVGICAVTIRKSLIWCNDQISASLSPAAMKQQAAAPSPFSADGLQPTLHRLSSYLSSPTNSPRRWSASVSSLQAELLQQPDVAPAAEMERRPSYSSLLEGAYPSRLLHDAAVTALRDESSQRWQAMQGTSPGREEVQWGRGLQQRGFLTDIPMQIWAVLLGFRGLTNNEGLDERAEDTYTDQFQAAQSVGQSTSTSLIVLQLAVSFFYLRALPGCQVRNIRGVLCFLPPIVKALAMEAASNPAWLQWLWHQAHGLSRSKRALQVFLVQSALLIQCLWRIWLLVLPYTYGEPTHGVDSAALYANSIVLLVQSLADPLTVAVVPVQKVWLLLPLSSLLSSATMLQAGTTKAIISVLLSILSSLFVIVATNVHRRRAFVRASCQGKAAF
ncbi:hypothetical protein DUNSADRAFT_12892 [Dunaliella salina]|uniref:Uncharacterized protein n=1 Tax=Dunaliella salina TaxID=3046 RepID=A0ABQ7H3K7_DUNSA|nr:hypothetical protein DUNSADRAFT_12892 [Dunaliella salina]|eukprot:KAF5841448.1 hypothetical protein DUNSADRAFT_12892 [Dunaliella salina]